MKKKIVKGVIVGLIALLILISFQLIIKSIDNKKNKELEKEFNEENSSYVLIDDNKYIQKPNTELILCVGLDAYEQVVSDSYTNTNLADFITLLVVDKDEKTTLPIHINRDTMCDVDILGVGGKLAGSTYEQICLAHSYGKGDMNSLVNVKNAVSRLLKDIKIDYYMSLSMNAVPVINDDVGGITVLIEDDFSEINPNLKQGEYVTLKGEESLTFVRTRSGLEDSSNLSRMKRQRMYLRALYEQCKDKKNDDKFVYNILSDVDDDLVANANIYDLSDLGNMLLDYELLEAIEIKGEAIKGKENMEYYVDENSLNELCKTYLFKEIND